MNSTRPYIIRAINEWCIDNSCSPHIIVEARLEFEFPPEHIRSGTITLNISHNSIRDLMITNEHISFRARFNGIPREIIIPIDAVKSVFAKEANIMFNFVEEKSTGPTNDVSVGLSGQPVSGYATKLGRANRPNLTIVK